MATKKSTKKTAKKAATKRKSNSITGAKSPASSFTPFQLASIAAHFLPPIVTDADWERDRGIALARQLAEKLHPPGNLGEDQVLGCDHRTAWEVLCDEAIDRADTLLQAAAGVDLRESAQKRAGRAIESNYRQTLLESAEPWKKKFKRRAKGREEVPPEECLKWILPASRNPMAYYEALVKTSPDLQADSINADRFAAIAILIQDWGEDIRRQTAKSLVREGGMIGGKKSAKLRGC